MSQADSRANYGAWPETATVQRKSIPYTTYCYF